MVESQNTRSSLLVRLRDPRDDLAWVEFTEIYRPFISDFARKRGLQEADVEDLAQEVFRAVARAIERYDPDPALGTFRGWLFRITNNLMINLLAAQSRHPRGSGDTAFQRVFEEIPDDQTGGDSVLFETEYRRHLLAWAARRARGSFSDAAWQAFWLTGVEGQPAARVAQSLGMSVGTIYQYKSRVVARIRREIERVEGDSLEPASRGINSW
jgi:RNA polymerase sigma-70 factor (ECF subfamily)